MQRAAASLLALLCCAPAGAQQWTQEELDTRVAGFLEPGVLQHWAQIGALLRSEPEARGAIEDRIHGDHREYLLLIERLIGQLTDERWPEREHAERRLIEIGGKAQALIEQHRDKGELLEERIRCARILRELQQQGTEKYEQAMAVLRGLLATAVYMQDGERLRKALVSALGHTDPQIVEGAIRALGHHGGDDEAAAIQARLPDAAPPQRAAILDSLARMSGGKAVALCDALLREGGLTFNEKLRMVRALRANPLAQDLLAGVRAAASDGDGALAAVAALTVPPAGAEPRPATLVLTSGERVEDKPFLGLEGNEILIGAPVDGLVRARVPVADCDSLRFAEPAARPAAACRVFLTQGSMVTGSELRITASDVALTSAVFGTVTIPRASVQGIALDPALDRLIGASAANDRARRKDGSFVDGAIVGLAETGVVLAGAAGEQTVPLAELAGLLFKRPLQTVSADDTVYTRVDLAQGDRIYGHMAALDAGHLGIVAPLLGNAVIPVADLVRIDFGIHGGALWGFTLIADYSDNRVVEVDDQGKELFVMEEVFGAWDAECLDNGNLLITEFSVSRVQEVTRDGKPVWSYDDLRNPYDADRLPNGNTLIADTFRDRVIEVDAAGKIVWSFAKNIRPFDVDRLPNGNTLIADALNDRVIEIDAAGEIVWSVESMPSVHDADRLPSGNTLITVRSLNKVIEVDRAGRQLWLLKGLNSPSDADRLPNGHTLVAEHGMVREFDRGGNVVWKKDMQWAVEVNRY
jgi:hypothetical protein